MSFLLSSFATTRDFCTVAYCLINVIRRLRPGELLLNFDVHASPIWVSGNFRIMLRLEEALSEIYRHRIP